MFELLPTTSRIHLQACGEEGEVKQSLTCKATPLGAYEQRHQGLQAGKLFRSTLLNQSALLPRRVVLSWNPLPRTLITNT
jgi:hypothetical protein